MKHTYSSLPLPGMLHSETALCHMPPLPGISLSHTCKTAKLRLRGSGPLSVRARVTNLYGLEFHLINTLPCLFRL